MAQYRKDTNQYLNQEKTIFEVVMLADQYGSVIGPANPSGMAVDAFGRARMSQPLTLFDSFHRYQDNGKLSTANSSGTSVTHDTNSSSVICSVGTANGQYIYRESSRVFAYQPGKSLQILQTYVMAPAQTGLRQRYGYFSTYNGIFLEQSGHNLYFVVRSNSNGTISENRVAQADWNVDTLDGSNTGSIGPESNPLANRNPSGITLDMSKAQIMFMDIEWLGLGTVRCGFVINGKFVHCHSFHHSNVLNVPYMGTACLPIRCEIENIADTGNTSNLRIVCSTVISEGGYELSGRPRTAGHSANVGYDLASADTWYPVACIRLKSERNDAIVIPKDVHLGAASASGSVIKYKIVVGANVSGGIWRSGGDDSSVQYNTNAASFTGGTDFVSGFVTVTNQASTPISLKDGLFRYQLERNSFNGTNTVFMIAAQTSKAGDDVYAAIDWEEVT